MACVALAGAAVFLQPERVPAQVAREVLELVPGRAREEARIDDPVALAAAFNSAMLLPPRAREERIALARRYSYADLGARYLAE